MPAAKKPTTLKNAGTKPAAKKVTTPKATGAKSSATRKPRGRPAARNGESATISILNAAVEEFGLHGFEGANITEIAKRAGVAKPLVHYHYKTKDKLWYAAVKHTMSELDGEIGKLVFEIRGMDPIEAFKLALRKYAYFSSRNPNVARMIVSETVRGTDRAIWAQNEYQRPAYKLFGMLLEFAESTGLFKKIPPYHLLPIMNGAINAFPADRDILNKIYGINTDDQATLEQHLDIVIDTLLNGLLIPPQN